MFESAGNERHLVATFNSRISMKMIRDGVREAQLCSQNEFDFKDSCTSDTPPGRFHFRRISLHEDTIKGLFI